MDSQTFLDYLNIRHPFPIYKNLPVAKLIEKSILREEGILANNGALVVETGNRKGRSPKDKFIVKNPELDKDVWWGQAGNPLSQESWETLVKQIRVYLERREIFVFDGFAGVDPDYRIQIRVIAEKAWHALFAQTLFIPPNPSDVLSQNPDFTVVNVCGLSLENFKNMGLNSEAFIVINFPERTVLIGGTQYAGEIKKSIFSIFNYLLPKKNVLPMHCSANIGSGGDAALFFGLSGTGKTTLSADPQRKLIGDDEHGWTGKGIFNFEGGCYAKCIRLSKEAEPQIFYAIKFGSILENVVVTEQRFPDFNDESITENTRATYPISHIENSLPSGMCGHPKNIFFLAADAFGVLPPIARLSPDQAMYHFLSGYTAKLAGTESGILKPVTTFSACFGAPFLVYHPFAYAHMLGQAMQPHGTNIWLVNTGWNGGGFGLGKRMKIEVTRALLNAALDETLGKVQYYSDPVFGFNVPLECPNVPSKMLNPKSAWQDPAAYDRSIKELAIRFCENFKPFEDSVTEQVKNSGPRIP
ncbi:phosphoenolpyruvate carboxykinase (ATP) [bacterium]|nr:phosphoenolpyruvate carboxykinase (ATP) [bacterium]